MSRFYIVLSVLLALALGSTAMFEGGIGGGFGYGGGHGLGSYYGVVDGVMVDGVRGNIERRHANTRKTTTRRLPPVLCNKYSSDEADIGASSCQRSNLE
ncbi:preprotein translocase subunit SecG domain protein [Ancylostoma caninum]|uniref:Preprotein translocase subunit SecG domain protein n=1 Tax=Ancylostoma caninum TaxID=29170 RepID=A0A368H987_ANCCA|nr:preprotein translocase subunit SecG domain protein [Ancylostoma caninum]